MDIPAPNVPAAYSGVGEATDDGGETTTSFDVASVEGALRDPGLFQHHSVAHCQEVCPTPSLPDAGILVMSGVLNVGVCWGVGEDGRVLCPPKFKQPIFHKSCSIQRLTLEEFKNFKEAVDPHQVLAWWIIFLHCGIECTVREHLMTLRSHFIRRLDRHCTRKLYSLLQRFEENLSSPLLHKHSTELAGITTRYKLSGFPLHLHYSDIQHIVSTVESTGLHLCENEHVEYALAVCVHPYPNDVLSVWLCTASLIPK